MNPPTNRSSIGQVGGAVRKQGIIIPQICLPLWLRRFGFYPWVRKIPWRRKWQLTPGKFHGPRTLAGYSLQGCEKVGHDLATKQQ